MLIVVLLGYRNSDGTTHRSTLNESPKLASPEKEDRYYSTRGSAGVDDNGKVPVDVNGNIEDRGLVWPKLYIALSSKEKEEDFLAMKGCKPPQRPKKRAKIIQRTLLVRILQEALIVPGVDIFSLILKFPC